MKKYEQPDFSIHNTLYLFFRFVTLYCFNFLCLAVLEKNVMKTFGIHDSSTHCPRGYNVQPSRPHSSLQKCDKNILMFDNWRERKMKK